MSNTPLRIAVLLHLLVLIGCAGPIVEKDFQASMQERVESAYVSPYRSGDIDRWMEAFDESAVALHDGLPPLRGKKAIRGFGEAVAASFRIEQLDVRVEEVRDSGDWAWTWGVFDANFVARSDQAPPGVAGARSGKFALLWQRDSRGEWHIIMDMGNGMSAPPNQ